ncbi:MAG: NAD(P)-binding domain-containing protein [Cytophagales bacterium]|nr:NAD(P)-binding domain-containing protein [Cytophagales bacterium]
MNIGVFGTGVVGRTIAKKLTVLGHEVLLGTRDVENTLSKSDPDGYGNPPFQTWYSANEQVRLLTFSEVARSSELIFNCTNGQSSLEVLKAAGDLSDKILIDLANPLDFSEGIPPSLNPVNTDSLGEQIQRAFPQLKVVKTLNTMNAEIMVNPAKIEGNHDVFVSGNDEPSKLKVKEVLRSFGWQDDRIIDLGDISTARGTEMMLPVWLRLWNALGTADFNFHIQKNDYVADFLIDFTQLIMDFMHHRLMKSVRTPEISNNQSLGSRYLGGGYIRCRVSSDKPPKYSMFLSTWL